MCLKERALSELFPPPTHADAAVPASPKRGGWKNWLGAILGLIVLALAFWAIRKIAAQVTMDDIRGDIRGTAPLLLVLAALSAAASYVVLIGYDWLATRHLGYHLRWQTLAAAAFGSFTVSHALGLTVLTGGTVRYRMYTRHGVEPLDIAMIIALCGWTFWLGIVAVAGVGMLFEPDLAAPIARALPESVKALAPAIKDWAAALLLGGVAAYTVLAWLWRRPIRVWRYTFYLPTGRETLLQIAIGVVDLAFAGTALYLLLPAAGAEDWLGFLTIYAVAMVAGALSHAPGGLGVFELVIVSLLPASPKAGVLAALVLFRLIYTYIPFLFGLAVIAWTEAAALKDRRAGARASAPPIAANRRSAPAD